MNVDADRILRCNRIARAFGWCKIHLACTVEGDALVWMASTLPISRDFASSGLMASGASPESAVDSLEDAILESDEEKFSFIENGVVRMGSPSQGIDCDKRD